MIKKLISIINKWSLSKVCKKKYIIFLPIVIFLILGIYLIPNATHNNDSVNKNTEMNQAKIEADIDEQEYYDSAADTDNSSSQTQTSSINTNVNLVNDNRGVPVLYYHSVQEPADNEVTITPENLKTQLEYIKDQGYITLTINELKNYLLHNSPIPEKSIVITFDDGYMDNYYNAFPILKELNMKATIFCITSELDGSYYLSKDAINEMYNYGIDIESHTVNHVHLDKLTYYEQLKELEESKKTLESIIGNDVDAIAYPFGDLNNDSVKAAKAAGYSLAFTTNRGFSDRDDNPLKLDRIYVSSKYDMKTFKEILSETKK